MEKQLGKKEWLTRESLRALHRIHSDVIQYSLGKLSENRRDKANKFAANVIRSDLSTSQMQDLLKVHSETQPWHPELEAGIKETVERIEAYRNDKWVKFRRCK
jgi:hypothetical protein